MDYQELLLKRPTSIRRDLHTGLPSCFTVGLDNLVGGGRVTREVLCARKKERKRKNAKSENGLNGKRQARNEEKGGLPSTKSSIWP